MVVVQFVGYVHFVVHLYVCVRVNCCLVVFAVCVFAVKVYVCC